ncbi:MAG TPA: PDZ domain-containing protein [Thermoanaerobaculia bacterium]|jgi:tricorn protease|nr:PDZ domain-containing protein [Thermoanaerobaculia bacterium]
MNKFAFVFALFVATSAAATGHTLYQAPTLSRTRIAFAYAGDLWTVSRDGGVAERLTTYAGVESDPHFSPDGSKVAFTGEYDGNTDVYVISADGGIPQRLTFHPGADQAVGWTSDGKKVLFRSSRQSVRGYGQLFTIGLDGGLPELVPLPHADEGSFSPDDSRIAYQPISQWQPDWKRQKGGQTGQIWIARMSDSSIERVPHPGSNDHAPAWLGDTVYFISDRGSRTGTTSIYAYDTRTKSVSEVLENKGLDIKALSAGPDALVYEQFGTIFLLDPKTRAAKEVPITVRGDFLGIRARYEPAADSIRGGRISPSGARAVFEARGEIITVPVEKGDARNLTNTVGVMERDPAWSPDGKSIAYFSDESGEYALVIRDQRGDRPGRRIDLGTPATFYYTPVWSPDSTKVAYTDRQLNLWYVDVATGARVKVDTNPVGFNNAVLEPRWSPDSRWIAYSRHLPNLVRAVFVHSVESHKSTQITDGLSDVVYPVFDRNGKYLYVAASTDIGRGLSWADLSGIDSVATRNVYAVVLRNDLPSPLAPESDEEKADADKSKDTKSEVKKEEKEPEKKDAKEPEKKDDTKSKAEPVRIDFDGISQRILALPIPNGNVQGLAAGKAGILFVSIAPPSFFGSDDEGVNVTRFDLEKRKVKDFLHGVNAFDVSADGEKVLYQKKKEWAIAPAAEEPKAGEGALKIGAIQIRIDPRAEWRQMFRDVWLGERDHFYDENHHGLDLEAAKKFYEPYLDAVANRADLSYLFREMLNQLTIGHMFIRGGDMLETKSVPGGLLGCDFQVENGRYRFARVYNGENWNPEMQAPLTQPGVNVKAGEYLISVGGRDLHAGENVYAPFENTAGKQVAIRVGSKPDGSDAREVVVVPVASESALRMRAWIEDNRRKVDQLSGGRLAYIYIPNTGGGGYRSFNRDFFVQTQKEGAVVDERFNQGGLLADYVVNMLTRPQLSAIRFRYADKDVPVPAGAIYGPKAMLINSMSGSGGDAMPWYFKKMKVGPLVGTRTWGGLVASQQGPRLMDGGTYTAPDAAVYGLSGNWEVENAGVAPDIEVELDPAEWRKGRDTQLESAVTVLMQELGKHPRTEPVRPAFPVYERCCGLDAKH